jgi:hypothetical protein
MDDCAFTRLLFPNEDRFHQPLAVRVSIAAAGIKMNGPETVRAVVSVTSAFRGLKHRVSAMDTDESFARIPETTG